MMPRDGRMARGVVTALPKLWAEAREGVRAPTPSGFWVTPSARDWKDTPGMTALRNGKPRLDQLPRQVFWAEGTPAGGGVLNPAWVSWLMGFPLHWLDLR